MRHFAATLFVFVYIKFVDHSPSSSVYLYLHVAMFRHLDLLPSSGIRTEDLFQLDPLGEAILDQFLPCSLVVCLICFVWSLCYFVWSVLFVCCVLCLIVVPLPPGENPFAVKINNKINFTYVSTSLYTFCDRNSSSTYRHLLWKICSIHLWVHTNRMKLYQRLLRVCSLCNT
jgi:hypothetical protein